MNAVIRLVGSVGFTSTLGCASIQLPPDQVASFEASVHTAKLLGVDHLPVDRKHRGGLGMSRAKEHLVLANEQAEVAKEMAAAGDVRAVFLLARAQSDIDLAVWLAREAQARANAACAAGGCPAGDAHDSQGSLPPAPIWTTIP